MTMLNPFSLNEFEIIHRDDARENQRQIAPEAVVRHDQNGFQLRTPAHPLPVEYLRVCDPDGNEIAYWSIEEVQGDAAGVVGAIIGALVRGPEA